MTDITAGMGLLEDTEEQEQGGGGIVGLVVFLLICKLLSSLLWR